MESRAGRPAIGAWALVAFASAGAFKASPLLAWFPFDLTIVLGLVVLACAVWALAHGARPDWRVSFVMLLVLLLGWRREWLMGALALLTALHLAFHHGGLFTRVDGRWLSKLAMGRLFMFSRPRFGWREYETPVDYSNEGEALFQRYVESSILLCKPRGIEPVVVTIADLVYVQGEVKTPTTLKYTTDLTMLKAIAHTGGFTQLAAGNRVVLVRGSGTKRENVRINVDDMLKGSAPDIALNPNDIVIVPQRLF